MSTPSGPRPKTLALGEEARRLKNTKGMSQTAIADRLGVKPKQVERALRAAREVSGEAQPRVRRAQAQLRSPRQVFPLGWQERAACRGMDLVLFFGTGREGAAARERREKKAKAVCAGCPVRTECLDTAIGRPDKYGIWGGLSEDERATERRRRQQRARLDEQKAS